MWASVCRGVCISIKLLSATSIELKRAEDKFDEKKMLWLCKCFSLVSVFPKPREEIREAIERNVKEAEDKFEKLFAICPNTTKSLTAC